MQPESIATTNLEAGSLFFGLVSARRWEGRAGLPLAVGFFGRRMEITMVNLRGLYEQLTRQAELLSEGNECREFCSWRIC